MIERRSIPNGRVLERLDEYLAANDYTGAKRHLTYWLEEAKAVHDCKGEILVTNELMGLCRKLGEEEKALGYAKDAIKLIEKMGIENNVGAATTYLNSATVFKAFGRAEAAIPFFEKAREIYENNLSPDDERLGGLYNNMALAFVDLGEFCKADELYSSALTVMRKNEGAEPEQAITYLNMASAAETRYGLEGAQDIISACAQKATELLDSCKDRTDGDYAFACEKCATVFEYYGYFLYKKELNERSRRIYEGS